MRPVLLALALVPIVAIRAVTQVPILDPKIRNKAFSMVKAPCPTIIMITPVTADED